MATTIQSDTATRHLYTVSGSKVASAVDGFGNTHNGNEMVYVLVAMAYVPVAMDHSSCIWGLMPSAWPLISLLSWMFPRLSIVDATLDLDTMDKCLVAMPHLWW